MMPFHMGPWEIGLILVIILIVFGVGKLPQASSALGKGLRAFRQGQHGEEDEEETPKAKKKVTKQVAKKTTQSKRKASIT